MRAWQLRLAIGANAKIKMLHKKKNLSLEVRRSKNLNRAWQHVYASGKKSSSEKTRQQIEDFKKEDLTYLQRIYKKLQAKTFKFKDNIGIAPKKKGKSGVRPLVLMPVESRIVQRSILDTLQKLPEIKHTYLSIPTSFGGITKEDDGGVPQAINAVKQAIADGAKYYIKSDIKDFFTKIPISAVIEILSRIIPEKEFLELFKDAVTLEVNVLSKYDKHKTLFDYSYTGTPQGCCLSPLMGNMLLNEFDNELNKGDIYCFRYLDDFIILAPNEAAANSAFRKAERLLKKYRLEIYNPDVDKAKASKGHVNSKFEYLGIEFNRGMLRPSRDNRNKLISAITDIIQQSVQADFLNISDTSLEDKSTLKTLEKVSNILKGWGNTFGQCCNDYNIFNQLDMQVDEILEKYLQDVASKMKKIRKHNKSSQKIRRARGIHLLVDSKGIKNFR